MMKNAETKYVSVSPLGVVEMVVTNTRRFEFYLIEAMNFS
jgi:hypothetical protein